jgi:hypothetical protein
MKEKTRQLIQMKIQELEIEIQHKYFALEDDSFIEFHEFHNLEIELMKTQIELLRKKM